MVSIYYALPQGPPRDCKNFKLSVEFIPGAFFFLYLSIYYSTSLYYFTFNDLKIILFPFNSHWQIFPNRSRRWRRIPTEDRFLVSISKKVWGGGFEGTSASYICSPHVHLWHCCCVFITLVESITSYSALYLDGIRHLLCLFVGHQCCENKEPWHTIKH